MTEATPAAVLKWAECNRRALISDYAWAVRDDIDAANATVAQIFVSDDTPEFDLATAVPPALTALAQEYRGSLIFMTFRKVI